MLLIQTTDPRYRGHLGGSKSGGGDGNPTDRTDRLSLFSDGVFAVLITILVLELEPAEEDTLRALLPLWPTGLSCAVSYLFIAIVWVNHHHVLSFAEV